MHWFSPSATEAESDFEDSSFEAERVQRKAAAGGCPHVRYHWVSQLKGPNHFGARIHQCQMSTVRRLIPIGSNAAEATPHTTQLFPPQTTICLLRSALLRVSGKFHRQGTRLALPVEP